MYSGTPAVSVIHPKVACATVWNRRESYLKKRDRHETRRETSVRVLRSAYPAKRERSHLRVGPSHLIERENYSQQADYAHCLRRRRALAAIELMVPSASAVYHPLRRADLYPRRCWL